MRNFESPHPPNKMPTGQWMMSCRPYIYKQTGVHFLVGGRRVDYPHVIEREGHLLIAFAGGKQTVEVLKTRVAELGRISNSAGGSG